MYNLIGIAISENSRRITYKQFKDWLDSSNALQGFNLTETLLKELFSDLDPHKKGHLTQNDWVNAFGSYNWSNQILEELQSTVASSFFNARAAFSFFLKRG